MLLLFYPFFYSFALFLFLVFFPLHFSCAQVKEAPLYTRPDPFDFVTSVPETMKEAWHFSFNTRTGTLLSWGALLSSTLVLYAYDEQILSRVRLWGRQLGIGNEDHTRTLVSVSMGSTKLDLFRGPTDVGSALYFLGDGWTHLLIAVSFSFSGLLGEDYRAMQTGRQIFQGMLSSTIINQIAKRSFGRESPTHSTQPGGAWRPFPSFKEYNKNIPKYDAMPSGHVMTATMTYVIIDENYPEYRGWFRPFGMVSIALLALQMMNNSVHWSSDYPLGMAMGYVFGKTVTSFGREKNKADQKSSLYWQVLPSTFLEPTGRVYGLVGWLTF